MGRGIACIHKSWRPYPHFLPPIFAMGIEDWNDWLNTTDTKYHQIHITDNTCFVLSSTVDFKHVTRFLRELRKKVKRPKHVQHIMWYKISFRPCVVSIFVNNVNRFFQIASKLLFSWDLSRKSFLTVYCAAFSSRKTRKFGRTGINYEMA